MSFCNLVDTYLDAAAKKLGDGLLDCLAIPWHRRNSAERAVRVALAIHGRWLN